MNLLVIAPEYDRFIKVCGDNLARSFDRVTVLIPKWKPYRFGARSYYPFKNVERPAVSARDNVRIMEVQDTTPTLPLSARQLRKFVAEHGLQFDAVLSHFLLPYGYLGNYISRSAQATSTVVGHGFDVYDLPFRSRIARSLTRGVLEQADQVVTVSQSNRERLRALGCKKTIHVIPMGYDERLFAPADRDLNRKQLGVPIGDNVVLTVGNLVPIKNQGVFIAAIKDLLARQQNVSAFVVGGGECMTHLQQAICQENLAEHITLVGHVPHELVPRWISAADVVVLSSLQEGNPTVMFETLACGRPFVGSAVGGIPDVIVSEDYGLLNEDVNDYRGLSRRIEQALQKSWQTEKIAEYARQFSSRNLSQQLSQVIVDSA